MEQLLKQSYLIYRARKGRYCTTLEEYLYIVTRAGMLPIYKEITHRRVNAEKIDAAVLEMVSFGDTENFQPIKGFNNLQMPEEVAKSLKLMKNVRYKF